MRYFFAILSLLIAGLLLILGVGQRTFLAGPKTIDEVIETSSLDGNYLVVSPAVFSTHKGNPSVVLHGEDLQILQAEQRDISGWLAPYDHSVLDVDTEENGDRNGTLSMETIRGEVPDETAEDATEPPVNPSGNDMWINEYSGESSLTVSVNLKHTEALLITSGTEEMTLPKDITLMWAQPRNTPLAGPILLASGIFAALGSVLYLLALDHDRRGLGPRRGRRGPFQGLRNKKIKLAGIKGGRTRKNSSIMKFGTAIGLAMAGSLVLTACDASYWPQVEVIDEEPAQVESDNNLAVVPVSDQQLDQIIENIVFAVTEADLDLDPDKLTDRVTGAALLQRTSNYKIRKSEEDWRALPFLTTERAGYDLIQSTEKWPRTAFVTLNSTGVIDQQVETDEDLEPAEDLPADVEEAEAVDTAEVVDDEPTPTIAVVLHQESPYENYKINRIFELRGGIEMPEAAPAAEGTALLADDIQTLLLSPLEAAESLAAAMMDGEESENFGLFSFEDESLVEKMGGAWAKTQCVEDLTCSAEVSVEEGSVLTLSTGQSGSLVIATIVDSHSMKVDNERTIVKLSTVERALGLDGSYSGVTRDWIHQVLMYVPGQDSDKKITVLGSSSELVKVSGEKAKIDVE